MNENIPEANLENVRRHAQERDSFRGIDRCFEASHRREHVHLKLLAGPVEQCAVDSTLRDAGLPMRHQ